MVKRTEIPLSLQAKIGSVLIHFEEASSRAGRLIDEETIRVLMQDAEVRRWMDGLRELALLPVKR